MELSERTISRVKWPIWFVFAVSVLACVCNCVTRSPSEADTAVGGDANLIPAEPTAKHPLERALAQLPSVNGPPSSEKDFDMIPLSGPEDLVYDGFWYFLWIDRATDNVWLMKTGGFTGATEWYGPASSDDPVIKLLLEDAR